MKEVIYGEDLQNTIIEASNLICNAVSSTLGPFGNNVIVNRDDLSPFITNDGVTIAEVINSNNPKINTILELIKEASLKTNEIVGDGTTTTLVLLNVILNEGFKEIKNGKSGIKIKQELDDSTKEVIDMLNDLSIKPTKEDLVNVASISAGSMELGKIITEVFLKMKSSNSIKIVESVNEQTYYEIKKGYILDDLNIPSIYFKDKKEINLKDAYVVLLNGYLSSLEQISEIINEGITHNKSIVIIVNDYEESLMEEVILYNLQANKNIYLFKIPDYGIRKIKIMEDLSMLCDSSIIDLNYENVIISNLKKVNNVIIKSNELIIINSNNKVNNYLKLLKSELKNTYDTYERDILIDRINKLDKGLATIYIGGTTKTEIKEKVMRAIDAVNALGIASLGIVIGEGITYLKLSKNISNTILQKAFEKPFERIMQNAGENSDEIKNIIVSSNYEKIYNLETKEYDDVNSARIIDPVLVLIEAIKNSTSIAGMLLTTNYLVINESFNKDNNIL